MKARFKCIATVLNIRDSAGGSIKGELVQGTEVEMDAKQTASVWAEVKVVTGLNAGMAGYVRRKWIAQVLPADASVAGVDRGKAAGIIAARTAEFDPVTYGLGSKAKTWDALRQTRQIDCSGWVYLLTREILKAYGSGLDPAALFTHSDNQVTTVGRATGLVASGPDIGPAMLEPGCLIGLDFAEYSWDRNRALDIDHIVIVGSDAGGRFVSQSSSNAGGVNRVPLQKWLASVSHLQSSYRMHLVDPLLAAHGA